MRSQPSPAWFPQACCPNAVQEPSQALLAPLCAAGIWFICACSHLLHYCAVQEPSRALPEPSPFEVHPHPNWVPGGALIIQAHALMACLVMLCGYRQETSRFGLSTWAEVKTCPVGRDTAPGSLIGLVYTRRKMWREVYLVVMAWPAPCLRACSLACSLNQQDNQSV
eukprot:1153766-Pelagomonas_calceolata.AAC.7